VVDFIEETESLERVGAYPLFLVGVCYAEVFGHVTGVLCRVEKMLEHNEIVRRIWDEFEPELSEQGYELVDVDFEPRRGGRVLRLFVDCEGGLTLDDCTTVSEFVDPLLDAKGVIEGPYRLEVSSPGVDRRIRKPSDFARFTGERIRLHTYAPSEGKRRFSGELRGIHDGLVEINCDDGTYEIHLDNVKRANLDR